MARSRWSQPPGVILGSLTALDALNYLDRFVSAATLPLILTNLAISDAQGGLLQSLSIVAYSVACGPAGSSGSLRTRSGSAHPSWSPGAFWRRPAWSSWRAGQLWKQISGRRAVRLGLVAVGRRVVRYALDRHR